LTIDKPKVVIKFFPLYEQCRWSKSKADTSPQAVKPMNKRDLNQLKKRLQQQMTELLDRSDCNLAGLEKTDDALPDLMDQVAHKAEQDYSYGLCNRNNRSLREIEQALQDIENNEYGICKRCEENISIKRLKVRPVARYCIDCKTELEKIARQTGGEMR
jgi:DnaK suppressor protein